MNKYIDRLPLCLTLFAGILGTSQAIAGEVGRGVVAADHLLASECGAEILALGGNAADAAVATALCAGVVQPAGSGLGGGGFAVIVTPAHPEGRVLDFREVAPAAATRTMYVGSDGAVDGEASKRGGTAVAVPGESRGLALLLAEHGTLTPKVVARPAATLASRGFLVGHHLVRSLAAPISEDVAREFTVDGEVASHGDTVRRKALARTLKRWAATAGEDLHTGAGAAGIVGHPGAAGGPTAADLAAYEVARRAPIVVPWGDRTIVTMPPPSSGGVVLAQILRVLDAHDLKALGRNSSAYLHLLAETMKHAYADRAHHLGDPAFVDVPTERLLSAERVQQIRDAYEADNTLDADAYGERIAPPRDAGTQHISVVDAQGAAVALTTTINTRFGSQVVPPGVGVVLNNEMDDFSAAPGVPNAYGLVGSEANAIEAGKRPLSSMTPTVVLDADGHVELVIGASGGSTIISSTLQVLLNVLVFDMDPEHAVAAPRIHHQWTPDVLWIEPGIPVDVRAALEARGHALNVRAAPSSVQAIRMIDGLGQGGSDPRKGGRPAVAWP